MNPSLRPATFLNLVEERESGRGEGEAAPLVLIRLADWPTACSRDGPFLARSAYRAADPNGADCVRIRQGGQSAERGESWPLSADEGTVEITEAG